MTPLEDRDRREALVRRLRSPSRGLLLALLVCGSCGSESDRTASSPRFLSDEVPSSYDATLGRADLPTLGETGSIAVPLTLRDETRRSLVPPHASPVRLVVEVPPDTVLRFAIAAATLENPEFPFPLEFTVTLNDGERRETVFQERLRRRDRNRWLDREVSLASWAGARAQMVLETQWVTPSGPSSPGPAETDVFPVWGSPVVIPHVNDRSGHRQMILISIDCLRADHVGAYGYERDTTPHIDAFAKDAVVFETAIGTSATTLPTHTSMLTGLTPSEHGASNLHLLSRSVPYLPELLSSAGYQVDGVVSGAYLSQYFGFERGFNSYLYLNHPRASETIDAALRVLDRTEGADRFLFLHVIDAHWPYRPPEGFEERFGPIQTDVQRVLDKVLEQIPPDGPVEIEQARDLYDAEMAYVDQEVGRFLAELEKRELYEDALIILTADHGEAFYEHESWQHGWTLYDEIVHIPLIVKWPGSERRGRVQRLVSQVDLFATLLEEASLSPPHSRSTTLSSFLGEAVGAPERRYAVSEFVTTPLPGEEPFKKISFRTESRKYVVTFRIGADDLTVGEIASEELYDLTQDPDEQVNILPKAPSDREDLRRGLYAYLEEARAQRGGRLGDTVTEDDTIRERLRSLGYLTSK